jgi:hypothetical protein
MPNAEVQRHSLVPSDQVEGTAVRRSDGTKIGVIKRVMIDKTTGSVAYAVLNFGGFLGFGEKHYPVPWASMRYNQRLEAYELNLTAEELASAPSVGSDKDFDWGDRDTEVAIHAHYKASPYWGAY